MGDLRKWREAHGNKPILVTEYGADTVAGLHTLPSVSFSEEFQDDFMREYFRAFDDAKAEGWFIGEMVWNFADFMTKQEARRVAGNKKGLFTRLVENCLLTYCEIIIIQCSLLCGIRCVAGI